MSRSLLALFTLAGCARCPEPGNEVLFLGDSLLAFNEETCRSLGSRIALEAGLTSTNAAVNGSTLIGGDAAIGKQAAPGDWAHVVISGGANDLEGRCECVDCEPVLDRLVSEDGSEGLMAELVDAHLAEGSQVVLLGYYPGGEHAWYGFDRCFAAIDELNRRHRRLVEQREGAVFFDLGEVVDPESTPWAYTPDGVHPSPRGARVLGRAVAPVLE